MDENRTILLQLIKHSPEALSLINRMIKAYHGFCGLIVVKYDVNTKECVSYWDGADLYYFRDTATAYPYIFKTEKNAIKRAERLNLEYNNPRFGIGVAFWMAPEAEIDMKPLDKYILMNGGQLPGSPVN